MLRHNSNRDSAWRLAAQSVAAVVHGVDALAKTCRCSNSVALDFKSGIVMHVNSDVWLKHIDLSEQWAGEP